MKCRKSPCAECPWRKDTEPGQFPPERYKALRDTSPDEDGRHPGLGAPMFACHKADVPGKEAPCAGWLASVGRDHVTVRMAVATGEIPPEALEPGEDWPELHESYELLLTVHG